MIIGTTVLMSRHNFIVKKKNLDIDGLIYTKPKHIQCSITKLQLSVVKGYTM